MTAPQPHAPKLIRPLALCVVLHQGKILVVEYQDPRRQSCYYRPPGGTIEFGETSSQALKREMMEELGAGVTNLRFLGTLENLYTIDGVLSHELVLIYQADLENQQMYHIQELVGNENGTPIQVCWKSLRDFENSEKPLYPDGLYGLLANKGRDR